MMGRLNHDQAQLFYSFCLEEVVSDDHLVRKLAAVLDLSWVGAELAPHYPNNGRPSIDPDSYSPVPLAECPLRSDSDRIDASQNPPLCCHYRTHAPQHVLADPSSRSQAARPISVQPPPKFVS